MHAVENVSFFVTPARRWRWWANSGCGKSTTGRSILRLVEPSGGRVLFEGQDVRALDSEGLRKMRQRMQMIFQDPFASLNPRMSVGAAIAEPIIVHGLASTARRATGSPICCAKVGLTADMASASAA